MVVLKLKFVLLIETLLKLVNYKRNNWVSKLPFVTHAMNSSVNTVTGFSPFYLAHALEPSVFPKFIQTKNPALFQLFKQHSKDIQQAHQNTLKQQEQQQLQYDKLHSIPPLYEVDKFAWLAATGIKWPATVDQKLLQSWSFQNY